jgi:HD domain
VFGHSYRSWIFGRGLAAMDSIELDPELFYVACLLHDFGICRAVRGEDFTLRSAERALRCAEELDVPADSATVIADAITVHATPGIRTETDGALGVYIQAGALFDLGGLRVADLTRAFREDAIKAYPRAGVTKEITELIRMEARANPSGRFALLHRCGMVPLVKLAPLRPR